MRYFLIFVCMLMLLPSYSLPQSTPVPDTSLVNSAIKKFSAKDPFDRGEAIELLAGFGNTAVDNLLSALKDTNDDVRSCAAIALGKIAPQGTKAIPFLTDALKDKNSDIRWYSALALGRFKSGASSAVTALVDAMNDPERDVRWAAYTSLLKIDKAAINKAPDFSEVIKTIGTLTPQLMKALKVPGVSVSLIKDHKVAWVKSFGVSGAANQKPVNDKTMFEACSMSKPVFSFIVLTLVDQGKFDLDKPLYEYLPEEFAGDNEDYAKLITARMILTHTSGMPNWRKGGDETGGPLPLLFKPGTKFNYSGEGMFYLQRVVERITRQPLEVYAKEHLFDKLGLSSTSFTWASALDPQIATGHDTAGRPNERSKYTHANAAYTLITTPEEYAKFIIEIMMHDNPAGVSLSEKMVNEMTSHQVRVDTREVTDRPGRAMGLFSFRGLGWGIDSTATGNIIYHSGSNQSGFRCYSQFNMTEGSGIVIMTNSANGSDLWVKLISKVGDF